jgi:hypothetical protein
MLIKKITFRHCFILACLLFAVSLIGIRAAYALAGVYIYANNGSYYTQYGPSAYWYTKTNEGYCGHISSSCSPTYMKYTYTNGCTVSNYAKWDNLDSYQYGTEKIFIPRVNATTRRAPYLITYNSASSYTFTLNQYSYSDVWVSISRLYDIRNTWLEDDTCESSTYRIGFDEVQITI